MLKNLWHTGLTGAAALGVTGSLSPLVIALALKDPRLSSPVVRTWARSLLKGAGVRPVVEGLENLPEGTAVYVCNHQSHFDSLLILTSIQRHIRFVGKAELFKIPLFGAAMRAYGNIRVDRTGGEHDKRAMRDTIESVRTWTSVLFFAEGTRSPTGELGPFKKGAAMLAIQAGVPVVPLAVAGTKDILPKGSAFIHGGRTAALVIGKPLSSEGYTVDQRQEFTEKIREDVVTLYERAKAVAGVS